VKAERELGWTGSRRLRKHGSWMWSLLEMEKGQAENFCLEKR